MVKKTRAVEQTEVNIGKALMLVTGTHNNNNRGPEKP